MLVPVTRYISHEEVAKEVERVVQTLGPEVVRVRFQMTYDTAGDPAIYFRVVLQPWAAKWETLGEATSKIRRTVSEELKPFETWGLFPYFRFRSSAEHSPEPEWN